MKAVIDKEVKKDEINAREGVQKNKLDVRKKGREGKRT